MDKTCSTCTRCKMRLFPKPMYVCRKESVGKAVEPTHACDSWRGVGSTTRKRRNAL